MRRAPRGRTGRPPAGFAILHEDAELIVIDKPAGLLTVATESEKRRTAYALLYDHVKRKRPPERIFVVHRLDRDVSGLLVFAKSPEAKRLLQRQFLKRAAGRVYVALVRGRVPASLRTIRSHLVESAALKIHSTKLPQQGRLAVTQLRVVRRLSRGTVVEIRLDTGRKHQIRAHLAEAGHPIVGDPRYGGGTSPLHRLALHATRLSFQHPVTDAPLTFESPPPF